MVVGCWWFKRFWFFGCERFESRNELVAKMEGKFGICHGLFVKNSWGICRYLYSRSFSFSFEVWLCLDQSISTSGKPAPMALGHFFLAIDVEAICDLQVGSNGGDGWSRPLLCFLWCEMGWDDLFDLMMIATGIGTFWPCSFCSNMGNIHSPVKWLWGTMSHWNTFLNSGIWFFKSSTRDLSGQLEIKLTIALPTWALPRSSAAARSSRRSRVISCDICATRPRIPMVLDEFGQQARLRMHFARSERLKVGAVHGNLEFQMGRLGTWKLCASRHGKELDWGSFGQAA